MKVTVSLSVSRLVEILLAHSAAVCQWTGEDKPLLTRGSEAMLAVFIDEEIARLAMELAGIVESVDRDDSGDLRLLQCELDAGLSVRVWRRNAETAVCGAVMARYAPEDVRDTYLRDRKGLLAALRREAMPLPGSIARGA